MFTKDSVVYSTDYGMMIKGKCEDILLQLGNNEAPKANLIFTSPPFPLNRAKKYGNMTGDEYLKWIESLATIFANALQDDGSIVMEIGNAWEPHLPIQSTLPMEALLAFKKAGELYLCQEFIHYNPARLPAPVEYVNKQRIRVKDAFTRIWWLSKSVNPKANNRNVLEEYSRQMKKLISTGKYNPGSRPSEYIIGETSFLKDNGGAIPGNVIIASNTSSIDSYLDYCRNNGLEIHPARMPRAIPEFFIKLLTDENDMVLDPFAGSNTTGYVAEKLRRKWLSIEIEEKYIEGSRGRFL